MHSVRAPAISLKFTGLTSGNTEGPGVLFADLSLMLLCGVRNSILLFSGEKLNLRTHFE